MSVTPSPPAGGIPPLPAQLAMRTDSVAPRPGDVLDGRYLLEQTVGAGGVGTVFRALQFRVKRPVAVKFLHHARLGEHELGPRFEREALALAALGHPNIVRLQDYGVTRGMPYLVMELIDGRTLREVIDQDGALPVQRALRLLRQLLHALAYAHEQGIVHRDIKPANVIVQPLPHQPEHVKVLDFGFAKFLPGSELGPGAQLTRPGFAFGSPAYISPEQCTGEAIDGRADLYSVGVLLFEMLTGTCLFEGDTPELLRQHIMTPAPTLGSRRAELGAQTQLQAILDCLLAKSRTERFGSVADVLNALDRYDASEASAPHMQVAALPAPIARVAAPHDLRASFHALLRRSEPVLRAHLRSSREGVVATASWLRHSSEAAWQERGKPAALRALRALTVGRSAAARLLLRARHALTRWRSR